MKIVLKREGQFCKLLKADFYGNKIIGEMYLFSHLKKLLPHATEFHAHFIYFENGNYHYSIKYFDTTEKCYIDRKVFHNHISLNKSYTREFDANKAEKFERDENNELDRYMLSDKMPAWKDASLAFNTGAFYFATSNVDDLNWVAELEIKDGDILLDINEFPNTSVNICAVIYTKDKKKHFDLSNIPNSKVFESVKSQKNLYLKIYALVRPLEN